MAKILSFLILFSICACVSLKKYNSLEKQYQAQTQTLQTYEEICRRMLYSTKSDAWMYGNAYVIEESCDLLSKPIKYDSLFVAPASKNYCSKILFNLDGWYNAESNIKVVPFRDTLKPHLLAYACCPQVYFKSKSSSWNINPRKTRYRFIHEKDTFWVNDCLWAVDSLKKYELSKHPNKQAAINGGRHKYGYDVYMQCVDCSSAFKNEKGECLCSR